MSNPNPPAPPPAAPVSHAALPFGDMRVLLIIMGIVIILLGTCGCAGGMYLSLIPTMILSVVESGGHSTTGSATVSSLAMGVIYLASIASMIWLGIGSLIFHKWARALLYAMGWFQGALILGGLVCSIPVFKTLWDFASSAAPASAPGGTSMSGSIGPMVIAFGMMGVVYVGLYLIPYMILIVVYGLRDVRQTVQYFDPKPRWTDGLSVHVLAWWIFLVWAGITCLVTGPHYAVVAHQAHFPLSPIPMGVGIFLTGAAFLVVAWAVMRRKSWAWTAGLSVTVAAFSVAIIVLASTDFVALFDQQIATGGGSLVTINTDGAPEVQRYLEETQAETRRFLERSDVFWLPLVIALALLVSFLVWIRPHFLPPPEADDAA